MQVTQNVSERICFNVTVKSAVWAQAHMRGREEIMCGIIGAALKRGNAAAEVYCGLKRLEYRGYDSSGLSVLENGKITTVKRGGKVEAIEGDVAKLHGSVAIGHTRWATHGAATDNNAHPHTSGRFSLVHNGIIENFAELKAELMKEGARFNSDTDSEVIVKLIEKNYKGDLLSAVSLSVKLLKGSFALAILCEGFNGLIAVKYNSPAVVGFSQNGTYLCSDVPALPAEVTSVCIPDDGDIAVICCDFARFYDFSLKRVNRVRRKISLKSTTADKGGYEHYMLKEINEESRTVRDTADSFLRSADLKRLAAFVRSADKIIITGCGTAYNAGLIGKRYFEESGAKFVFTEIASELRSFPPKVTQSSLVFAVSQSGETADTLEAARSLSGAGAKIVAVTNCGYSALCGIADAVVPVCAGAEICVAATKSYSGQLADLYLLSRLGDDILTARDGLINICREISEAAAINVEEVAALCAESSAVFFLGRGIDYAVAVEASLKLKEISYIFSDGYPAGELKHGTLALIDEKTLSIFIITDPALAEKCENAVEQVISRKGKAAVFTTLPQVAEKLKDRVMVCLLPQCETRFSPFITSAALQKVAYRTALILGRDPDKPRNLAKSVTVE